MMRFSNLLFPSLWSFLCHGVLPRNQNNMLGEQLSITDLPLDSVRSLLESGAAGRLDKAERFLVQESLVLRPASTSQRSREELHGRCKNLSTSGCGVILDLPPLVGDFYQLLTPKAPGSALHGVQARCVRCHLIDEDAFDAGFRFFTPITLPPVQSDSQGNPSHPYSDPLA